MQVPSHYGVVNERVRMGKSIEHLEGIIQISIVGKCTKLDESAHGVVVGRETNLNDLRVQLLELRHSRAGREATQWRIMGVWWRARKGCSGLKNERRGHHFVLLLGFTQKTVKP